MGIVYKFNSGQMDPNNNLIKNYNSGTIDITNALITPGQKKVSVRVAEVDAEEVESLLQKIDGIANSYVNEAVAVAYAEIFPVILTAMRMVKDEAKAPFRGMISSGTELDAVALIPENVGGAILNPLATGSLGLYGGTSGEVYTWLKTVGTVGTAEAMIPSQTMAATAAVIHVGAIDTVDVPKYNRIKFELSGVPTPAQSLLFNIRGKNGEASFVKFHRPVLVGPLKKQKIEVDPNIAGDSKLELMSILIAKADAIIM